MRKSQVIEFFFTEKSGCKVEDASSLVKYVLENCKYLEFMGLMTIGEYGYDISKGPNPDFLSLVECRKKVCENLGLDQKNVELSMGMSSDYEHAVRKINCLNFISKDSFTNIDEQTPVTNFVVKMNNFYFFKFFMAKRLYFLIIFSLFYFD